MADDESPPQAPPPAPPSAPPPGQAPYWPGTPGWPQPPAAPGAWPAPPGGPQGSGPYGSAPYWPAPPPPRKRKLTWLWVTLGVLAVIGVVVISSIVWFVSSVRGPVDEMNAFLGDVRDHDYTAAYDRLCSSEKASTTRYEFPAAIAPLADALGDFHVYSFDPSGDRRRIDYTTSTNGRSYTAQMVKEGSEWKVCDVFDDAPGTNL